MKDRSIHKGLIGKRVIINSYKVTEATGVITSYIDRTHHYWVKLDKPIKRKDGQLTYMHKCNAGNAKVVS